MLQDNSILCQVERMITEWSVKVLESFLDIEDVKSRKRITNDWSLKDLLFIVCAHVVTCYLSLKYPREELGIVLK